MSQHLWEIKHNYYCSESNYFTNEDHNVQYETFEDFLKEWVDADKDYNLLFRWDWIEGTKEDVDDDEDYFPTLFVNNETRNGELRLYYMTQRKGYKISPYIKVCRNDEEKVKHFLKEHWENMKNLWSGVSE